MSNRDRTNAIERNHDTTVFLDAIDGTLDTFEGTVDDLHPPTDLLGEVLVAKEHHTVVLHGGHAPEVGHVMVGNGDDGRQGVLVMGAPHHEAQGEQGGMKTLEVLQTLLRRADKNQVVDGREELALRLAIDKNLFPCHGEEGLHLVIRQVFADRERTLGTTMGYAHGEPGLLAVGDIRVERENAGGHCRRLFFRITQWCRRGERR